MYLLCIFVAFCADKGGKNCVASFGYQTKQIPCVLWRDTLLSDESRECAHLQYREAPPHHG